MYFFKVEISLFDEDKETIFLVPDTDALEKDELPVFSENELTAHPTFAAFLKRTKTAIVDVSYQLFEAKDTVLEEMDTEKYEELAEQKKLKLLDGNDFCIQTRKIKNHHKKGKSLFPKIGIAAAALLLIVGAVTKKMRSKPQPQPEPTSEITSDIVYSSESLQSVPEAAESSSVDSSEQSTAQLPESSIMSATTISAVQQQPINSSSAVSSAVTSTATRSNAQSSSAAPYKDTNVKS